MSEYREPTRFDIELITITVGNFMGKFEFKKWEIRNLIQLYHLLYKQKNYNMANDIKKFVDTYAHHCKIYDFDITKKVSLKKIGIKND